MNELRERLDDAARDEARHVQVDAGAAWAEGARRRVRRRIRLGAVAAAVVAAALVAAPATRHLAVPPAASDAPRAHADHYPARIDYDWFGRAMPAVTGPLAGVIERNDDDLYGWYAVSPGGRTWRIADASDIVNPSPDGTRLAYMAGPSDRAVFTITDQLRGTRVQVPDVSTGYSKDDEPITDARYFHSMQQPFFWNADATKVLLQVGDIDLERDDVAAGIVDLDGTLTLIRNSPGLPSGSHPIGWYDDHTVAFVAPHGKRSKVVLLDVASQRITRSVVLRPSISGVSQWYAWLLPGAETVMTVPEDEETGARTPVRFFGTEGPRAGHLRIAMPDPVNRWEPCGPSFSNRDQYLPLLQEETTQRLIARVNGGALIAADPRLHIACSVWATSALDGGPDPSISNRLFGDSSTWLSWHWRELLCGVLAGLTSVAGLGMLWRWSLTGSATRRKRRSLVGRDS